MKGKELNDYIKHYLERDKTQSAIMLTGAWGSGKSYYIEHELVPFLNKLERNKCVVVSLYGLESLVDISKSIYIELRKPAVVKQTEKSTAGMIVAKNIIKNMVGLAGIDFRISDKDLEKLYGSIDLTGKLLILEDLERSSIGIDIVLGYVNSLVERDGIKVLLVANEDEIIQRKRYNSDRSTLFLETDEKKEDIPDNVKKYLRIKEKTISDTIQFSVSLHSTIRGIINEFNNERLDQIVDEEMLSCLVERVHSKCRDNLRTFIFAIQKTVDIFEKLPEREYEQEFYNCIVLGSINLAAKIKMDKFPEWTGLELLSTELGDYNIPLMRFVYNYIRWQRIDEQEIEKSYQSYKQFKFYNQNAEYNDEDLRTLKCFSIETEEAVRQALGNIENKLQDPSKIGIYAYNSLAYYMIYVAEKVEFNSDKACKLMISNVKGSALSLGIDPSILFLSRTDIEDPSIREKYNDFIEKLILSMNDGKGTEEFSYDPNEISRLYTDVCKHTAVYVTNHQFISNYKIDKLVGMLKRSTSGQIEDFRGILFAVYRYARKSDFVYEDVRAMKDFLAMVEKSVDEENNWDKIQKLQMTYLCSNLRQFISQMS